MRFALDDDDVDNVNGTVTLLTSGDARQRLAGGLLHAADAADELDRDLNSAVAKRRRLGDEPYA